VGFKCKLASLLAASIPRDFRRARTFAAQGTMAASSKPKSSTLYCRNFPAELKKRCDGLAGFLGKSITDFVAEILEEETKEMIESHEAAKRWYEAKLKKRNRT
jgi:hypothetical protein